MAWGKTALVVGHEKLLLLELLFACWCWGAGGTPAAARPTAAELDRRWHRRRLLGRGRRPRGPHLRVLGWRWYRRRLLDLGQRQRRPLLLVLWRRRHHRRLLGLGRRLRELDCRRYRRRLLGLGRRRCGLLLLELGRRRWSRVRRQGRRRHRLCRVRHLRPPAVRRQPGRRRPRRRRGCSSWWCERGCRHGPLLVAKELNVF